MKKIIDFCNENGIECKREKFGNPYYFNDGFSVDGLIVSFDFYIDREASHKMNIFEKIMSRKKSYDVECFRFGAGWSYRIFTVFDKRRLEKHTNAIKEATEKFWEEEHARRALEGKAI